MSDYTSKFDSETANVIDYLKTRNEVCDLNIEEIAGVNKNLINEWESRNYCYLPEDLKAFYLNHNGMLIQWKVKVDNNTIFPLGKIQINSLKDLTKVGSVLNKDFHEPSIFDLDDLQIAPREFIENSKTTNYLTSSSSTSSLSSSESPTSHYFLSSSKKTEQNEESTNEFKFKTSGNFSDDDIENENETEKFKEKNNTKVFFPHFDESSKNFEIDNCNGYGKVCMVYRNCKIGVVSTEQTAEFWYLDRSFQWHYLTNSFKNYYRLLIAHLGLPQWQMLFTEDGLPPFLYQWYYLFAPGRILIHQDYWKRLEFLNLIEITNTNSTPVNSKKQLQKQHSSANQKKKIDFNKLFDEKNSKNKTQTTTNAVSTVNNTNEKNNSNSKSKTKMNIKK